MAATFAALQQRVNSAVVRHLANATADFGGGVEVDGLFRQPYGEAFGGMISGNSPTFEAESADLAAIAAGAALTIASQSYTVSEVHLLGAGMTQLVLRSA